MAMPLEGVRVLAVEQFGAGPWATLQLADLGAEVIKIEDPASAGDVGRYVPPFQKGEDSLFFETFNRNKKSISLDLRHPDSRAVLEDLVRAVDVVYSNLRGDQPAKLGLTYEARRDGVGCDCDISLLDTALHELMYVGTWAASGGYAPPRRRNSAHPSIVPFQNFRAADGWIVIGGAKQKFWERLCEVMGEPQLGADPASEAFLHEVVGAPPTVGRRNLNTESMFEYGSRAGFWRVHRIFRKHGLPLTVYAVAQALERNPAAARAMID